MYTTNDITVFTVMKMTRKTMPRRETMMIRSEAKGQKN
jgi:hypothetical protein